MNIDDSKGKIDEKFLDDNSQDHVTQMKGHCFNRGYLVGNIVDNFTLKQFEL